VGRASDPAHRPKEYPPLESSYDQCSLATARSQI